MTAAGAGSITEVECEVAVEVDAVRHFIRVLDYEVIGTVKDVDVVAKSADDIVVAGTGPKDVIAEAAVDKELNTSAGIAAEALLRVESVGTVAPGEMNERTDNGPVIVKVSLPSSPSKLTISMLLKVTTSPFVLMVAMVEPASPALRVTLSSADSLQRTSRLQQQREGLAPNRLVAVIESRHGKAILAQA